MDKVIEKALIERVAKGLEESFELAKDSSYRRPVGWRPTYIPWNRDKK